MLYSIPDYYKEFQCIAGDCEDTCCAGWQIVADEASLSKYRQVKGPFRKRMMKSVDWRQKTFRQDEEKRCAFLNENNLCDMYTALGRDSLCRTCRLYPRHIEEFEDVREITLSVSCPEVARILMNRKEPAKFISKEEYGEEEYDYEEFDLFLYSQLVDARDVLLKIAQNRDLPLDVRIGLIYGVAHDMQIRVDREELFSCAQVLEKYQKESAAAFVEKVIENRKQRMNSNYDFARRTFSQLYKLELLKEDWYVLLTETELTLYARETPEQYQEMSKEFLQWSNQREIPWEIQKEQLLVYFLYTYFCGAVYDGRILAKAMMAIISVFLLEEMMKARWLRNDRDLDMEDVIEIVYRYSRELEHSDLNLKRMEMWMDKWTRQWKNYFRL
ncbi:MAG: flagellin lysine-N-methylase [Eubacteriales bacterium]|nr:flagellin lysine-N-methylase [Eubacteriales bacterium]